MTNEEAIRALSDIKRNCLLSLNEGVAVDIATSALERDRWISVDERLPDVSEKQSTGDWSRTVLFWCKPGFEAVGYYNASKEYWLTADEVSEYDWSEVTHWRPLPEPPKEET